MSAPASDPPACLALDRFIQRSVEALSREPATATESAESLLFLGAWSDAVPRLLIEDPVLAPTDKVVWQVIKLHARAGGATAFPSYRVIGRLANVRSQATVARALAMLRISRWLTLCARVRDAQGRFRGNVYAVHDEPLALADTLYLDPEHMAFLETAGEHAHGRVRSVAAAARSTIEDDVRSGVDVTGPGSALERRAEAVQTLHAQAQGGFFSFNRQRLGELRQPSSAPSSESEVGSSVRVAENSEDGSSRSSCCSSGSETTTTPAGENGDADRLHFPARLGPNHRALALMYLDPLPPERRQAVLDELEGRLRAERHGAPTVYNPLRFLKRLCDAAVSGKFASNLGVGVRAERAEREQQRHAAERPAPGVGDAAPLPPPDPNNPLVKRALELSAAAAERKQRRSAGPEGAVRVSQRRSTT